MGREQRWELTGDSHRFQSPADPIELGQWDIVVHRCPAAVSSIAVDQFDRIWPLSSECVPFRDDARPKGHLKNWFRTPRKTRTNCSWNFYFGPSTSKLWSRSKNDSHRLISPWKFSQQFLLVNAVEIVRKVSIRRK